MSKVATIPTSDDLDNLIAEESCVTDTPEYRILIESITDLLKREHRTNSRMTNWDIPSFDNQSIYQKKLLMDSIVRELRSDDTKRVTVDPTNQFKIQIEWSLPKPDDVVSNILPSPPSLQQQQQQLYPQPPLQQLYPQPPLQPQFYPQSQFYPPPPPQYWRYPLLNSQQQNAVLSKSYN